MRVLVLAVGLAAALCSGEVLADPRVLADVELERAFEGMPFVRVTVNGSEPLAFLIDTGGAGSILDRDVAKRLGMLPGPGRASASGVAALDVGVVPKAKVRLGDATIDTRLMTVSLASLAPTFGRRVDGILGGDFLKKYAVEFNYDRNRIVVYEDYQWNGEGDALPIRMIDGIPFVHLELRLPNQKRLSGRFLIDSGGGRMSVHVHREAADRVGWIAPASAVAETGRGIAATTQRTVVRAESLLIGPHTFDGPPVAITENTAGLRADPGSVGLVGIEVLRNFNIVFDYASARLYLRPNREFSSRLLYDATGLRLRASPPKFAPPIVGGVIAASPAATAGFEAGDIILEIDGEATSKLTLEEVRGLLRLPGKRHLVTVRRNAKKVDLMLMTKELL